MKIHLCSTCVQADINPSCLSLRFLSPIRPRGYNGQVTRRWNMALVTQFHDQCVPMHCRPIVAISRHRIYCKRIFPPLVLYKEIGTNNRSVRTVIDQQFHIIDEKRRRSTKKRTNRQRHSKFRFYLQNLRYFIPYQVSFDNT